MRIQSHARRWRTCTVLRASRTIARAWILRENYAHARGDSWSTIRARVAPDDIAKLCRFSVVRHEWRTEPESWTDVTAATVTAILRECDAGLFGARSSTLSC